MRKLFLGDLSMIYGEKLKEIRENLGITQRAVSTMLELDIDVYGQYEREYYIMPIKHLIKVANYFNISLDYIFGFTKDKNYNRIRLDVDNKDAGNRLKEFRKEKKLTQNDLKNILNTTQSVISDYERGRMLINTLYLYDICKKYNISADYLMGRIDDSISF